MTIRILHPDDEVVLETFLLPRIESSLFLLGNMRIAGLADNGRPYQGTYAAAFADGAIVGAAALFWNGMLVVQAPEQLDDVWRTAVAAADRPIQGLIGPADQVQRVKDSLAITADAIQLDETEHLYSLALADLMVPEKLQTGVWHGRRITTDDLDQQTAWRVAYMIEEMHEHDTPELWQRARHSLEFAESMGRVWCWKKTAVSSPAAASTPPPKKLSRLAAFIPHRNGAAGVTAVAWSPPRCSTPAPKAWAPASSSPASTISRRKKHTWRSVFSASAITACCTCAARSATQADPAPQFPPPTALKTPA